MPGRKSLVPDLGWVGFDAANRKMPDGRLCADRAGLDARGVGRYAAAGKAAIASA